MHNIIRSIQGAETGRSDELPVTWAVGYDGVKLIVENTENLGTYGINWFECYGEDGLIAKMNALHVASVTYKAGS